MGKSRKKSGPPSRVQAKQAQRKAPAASSIKPLKPGEEKTVLQIGWGSAFPERLHATFKQPGWKAIRMDISSAPKPDIIGTFLEMPMLESASVDAIWCPYVFPRFTLRYVLQGLRECFRVLREEGQLYTAASDGQLAATFLAHSRPYAPVYQSPAGPVHALDMLFGFGCTARGGKTFSTHRSAFTQESLGLAMR